MGTLFWKRYYKLSILLHVLAWVGFISLPVIFIGNRNMGISEILRHGEFWFFIGCFIIPYYINSYLWTPYIIQKRKYVLYVISIVFVGVVFAFWLQPFHRLMQLDELPKNEIATFERESVPPHLPRNKPPFPDRPQDARRLPPPEVSRQLDIASVYIVMLVIILGSLVKIVQYWIQSQQKVQQIRHALTKKELAFLKAQVHPHFLFNTLNNIYSLALTGDPSTATSIYKLSQLMRYYMDERNEEEVDLKDEIQAIQDFISLQKLRIDANCTLTEQYAGLDIPKRIYPFILFPFVENAFKYGLSTSAPCYLEFCIQVTANYCSMEVKNSVSKELLEQPSSGIGLKNTRKLLEHLYPNKFQLDITKENDTFFVKLLLYI